MKITGADELIKQLRQMEATIQKETKDIVFDSATDIETGAITKVPVNMGQLKQGVFKRSLNRGLSFIVGSNTSYAPFVEFGTRSKLKIPPGYEKLAARFKNSGGGNFDEFLESIIDWVDKKKLTGTYSIKTKRRTGNKAANNAEIKRVAYLIAMSILKKGINPQPFLIPSYEKGGDDMIKKLRELLERATKR